MDATTESTALEAFVQTMTERMASLARTLGAWVQAEPRTLQQQEEQLLGHLHDLGTTLLSGLLALAAPSPPPSVTCPCGAAATFRRLRPATVTTLLGRLTYSRATYGCATCHHGHAPLDHQLQVAAGSFSLGLQELLAFLGATQDSFAEAAALLARLCLVQVCPNSARAATEELGATLVQHTQDAASSAQKKDILPPAQSSVPRQLYISMDGVLVHCRESGWRELKTGCVYTTRLQRSRRAPYERVLRMEQPSYSACLAEAAPFGWQLCVEAAQRGVGLADEVIVIGDGAHWIWTLAEQHYPGATQIVDWYHASQYVWNAATSIHGEASAARTSWAKQQLDALWEGRLDEVLCSLAPHAGDAGAVDAAVSYYTSQRGRMDYPRYRARNLQIGSGTIESTCKHLISARLKQAGMIWSEEGANAVSAVRAWLKSGRWGAALALRAVPQRRYQQSGLVLSEEGVAEQAASKLPVAARARELPVEVRERVQAELAAEAARHPWRRGFSSRQQRQQMLAPPDGVEIAATA
jgi:Uncharacterised protein family (UPF0236)